MDIIEYMLNVILSKITNTGISDSTTSAFSFFTLKTKFRYWNKSNFENY